MPTLTPFARTCLARQGFDPDDADVGRVQLALRFTPAGPRLPSNPSPRHVRA